MACEDCATLLAAVNAYLAAQNFAGHRDGDYCGDEGCREVRRRLCEAAYCLNAAREQEHSDV